MEQRGTVDGGEKLGGDRLEGEAVVGGGGVDGWDGCKSSHIYT